MVLKILIHSHSRCLLMNPLAVSPKIYCAHLHKYSVSPAVLLVWTTENVNFFLTSLLYLPPSISFNHDLIVNYTQLDITQFFNHCRNRNFSCFNHPILCWSKTSLGQTHPQPQKCGLKLSLPIYWDILL